MKTTELSKGLEVAVSYYGTICRRGIVLDTDYWTYRSTYNYSLGTSVTVKKGRGSARQSLTSREEWGIPVAILNWESGMEWTCMFVQPGRIKSDWATYEALYSAKKAAKEQSQVLGKIEHDRKNAVSDRVRHAIKSIGLEWADASVNHDHVVFKSGLSYEVLATALEAFAAQQESAAC